MIRKLVISVIVIAGFLGVHTIAAGVPGTELYLVSTARSPGAQGSQWYTTVWIHNLSRTDQAMVTVAYLERNRSNTNPMLQSLTLEPRETLTIEDVFLDLFGLQQGAGALRFSSNQDIGVSARIYNLTVNGLEESQGQFMAAMPAKLGLGLNESSSIAGITQPLNRSFRSNFALVECSGQSAEAKVTLRDKDGNVSATRRYDLAAFEARQFQLDDLGSSVTVDGGLLELKVTAGSGKILGAASNVANGTVSQDPSTLEMEYFLEQTTAGEGDITAVYANEGLFGGGDSGDVTLGINDGGVTGSKLAANAVTEPKISSGAVTTDKIADDSITNNKIADGQILTAAIGGLQVTQAKLSASGGASGQVLGTNGSSLVWQNPSSFTLPYSGTVSTATNTDAFYIGNTGAGRALQVASGSDTALWAQSTSGIGIDARSTSNDGIYAEGFVGVFGKTESFLGAGVQGQASDGIGVYGEASDGVFGVGVLGVNDDGGDAGYFTGNVQIDGNLSKSGGSFKIDHPLEPESKFLYHSFVESPDMKNIYDGNVTTDAEGFAEVLLPEWFDALNRDFRYQLTVIGSFAQAIVSEEIHDNRFSIRTDKPNIKVSWQVTGIRHDRWAEAHRIPIEQEKTEREQGHFIHPELWGQPPKKSIVAVDHPAIFKQMENSETE